MDMIKRATPRVKKIAGLLSDDALKKAVLTGIGRPDLAKHPLMSNDELLLTDPTTEAFLAIRRAVLLRETGLCFSAPSGSGKSSAIEIVQAMIKLKHPDLPVFVHSIHNHQVPSIRAFFQHFLDTVLQPVVPSEKAGETYNLRRRLVHTLVDDARLSGSNSILLLVDEAQAMLTSDFLFLKDVYNDLHSAGIEMTSVLVGQSPDLAKVIAGLRSANRADLIGRFAMRHLEFRCLRDENDIRTIFSAIDHAEYPRGSGISWTMAFFPYLWVNQGFRLENETEPFMRAFSEGKEPREQFNIPARQAFLAIRAFVMDNARIINGDPFAPDAWKSAVEYAKLYDAIISAEIANVQNATVAH